MSSPISKLVLELTDEQLETVTFENLKETYRALRDHHIKETTQLWDRVIRARRALYGDQ